MMDFNIIDAHSHLWLRQDTEVNGLPIRTLTNGRSLFMGEERQMVPPFMIDGRNSAEVFLSNMDYAQVSAAVVTQEFIDGIQNEYLAKVAHKYPDRFFVCGMCEFRKPGYLQQAKELISSGFKAIKIPAHRLFLKEGRVMLNCDEMMEMFHYMEDKNIIRSNCTTAGQNGCRARAVSGSHDSVRQDRSKRTENSVRNSLRAVNLRTDR